MPLILIAGLAKSGLVTVKLSTGNNHLKNIALFSLSVLLFAVLVNNAKYWMPEEVIENRSANLRKNIIEQLKPVAGFIKVFQKPHRSSLPELSHDEMAELRKYGFPIYPDRRFPVLKNKI